MDKEHAYYLPNADAELLEWAENFHTQLTVLKDTLDVSNVELTDLRATLNTYKTLYEQARSPEKTSVIIAEKNEAKDALKAQIRALVNFRLRNPVVTNAIRVQLGLHVRDTVRTTIPVPASRPEVNLKVFDVRRIHVSFSDVDSSKKARPYGVNGAVIAYAVLESPPTDLSALTQSLLATRTPHTLEFAETDRGNTVYVALCWQNEKGEKGPWSEIQSSIIP
ncbi:MAG: hypothetical protein LBQ77_05215 [Treponema sp.]|jgi:hypothetical protein|nr:hypothetical protein [Treponema sp.]